MFRNELFVTRTLILQHGLYCFLKKNVIMKDYAIFRNWIDKADSAPLERVRNKYHRGMAVQDCNKNKTVTKQGIFYICAPE